MQLIYTLAHTYILGTRIPANVNEACLEQIAEQILWTLWTSVLSVVMVYKGGVWTFHMSDIWQFSCETQPLLLDEQQT